MMTERKGKVVSAFNKTVNAYRIPPENVRGS